MDDLELVCILAKCKKKIPYERAIRGANTCSDECRKELTRLRRLRRDEKRCRHCQRPSTPEERKEFLAWRRSHPDFKDRRGRPPKNKAIEVSEPARD